MKFALDSNHLDYFEKNHFIEFDSLLTEKEIKEVQTFLPDALLMSTPRQQKNEPFSEENLFFAGHDLRQAHPYFRKIIMKRQWAEFASTLIQRKPLRLGYDQLFPGVASIPISKTSSVSLYTKLLQTTQSLEQISSIQEILCGVILCIQSPSMPLEETKNGIFTTKQGSGVFIGPKTPINFAELTLRPHFQYLLITYIGTPAVYIMNEMDPHTHFLKNYGYNYGDKLKEKYHPVVYR